MHVFKIAVTCLALASGALPARAQSWQSSAANDGMSAGASITIGQKTLHVGCNQRLGNTLFFTLSGGPHPGMKNADDQEDSMMMWITMADGRTAKHPIDGHYVGGEATFVGQLPATSVVMDQFADGQMIEFTATGGGSIFSAGMAGTTRARAIFAEACGI